MLADNLKCVLACSYVFAVKTQNFHWNVEGPDFPQLHKLFNKIYTEVNDNAIDRCAELIRSLDEYTPGSLQRFLELSKIPEQTKIPRAELMVQELLHDSETLISVIMDAFTIAQESGQEGIANFLAERQEAQAKWAWQLRSILKKQRA